MKKKHIIPFVKMEGTGNDYIYINDMDNTLPNVVELAKRMSQYHYGVGSDGLILIKSGKTHPFRMEMYNADGSQAEMCGNGLRCMAKYLYEAKLIQEKQFVIETGKGNLGIQLHMQDDLVNEVTIDMGCPIFSKNAIPIITKASEPILNETISIEGWTFLLSSVSLGNPHCVIFLDDHINLDSFPIEQIGPKIQESSLFPKGVNVEFVQQISRNKLIQRTWERGSGETLSCGTGACASVVVAVLLGKTDDIVEVELKGGTLNISYQNNQIFLRGSVNRVFDGYFYI